MAYFNEENMVEQMLISSDKSEFEFSKSINTKNR